MAVAAYDLGDTAFSDPQTGTVSEVRAVVHDDKPRAARKQPACASRSPGSVSNSPPWSTDCALGNHPESLSWRTPRTAIPAWSRCRPHTATSSPGYEDDEHSPQAKDIRESLGTCTENRHIEGARAKIERLVSAPTHWRCCSAIHSQTCVPSMLGSLRAT